MSDIVHPKKVGQNQPHMPSFFFGVVLTLVVLLVIQILVPLFSTTNAQEPLPMSTANVVQPSVTETQVPETMLPTVTPTSRPTKTPVPTAVTLTNEELAQLLKVEVVKHGEVSEEIVRLDLLAIKADQDYLIRHGVPATFPPIRLEIANSTSYSLGCEVLLKNGVITILQNVPNCYQEAHPISYSSGISNEGMNVYLQMSIGIVYGDQFKTVSWLWAEGAANYFGWTALFESGIAKPEENYVPIEKLEQGFYTTADLLNSRNMNIWEASEIGYPFMDYLIHKDGDDQAKIDENIRKVYEVFRIIGSSPVQSSQTRQQQLMADTVLTVFGQSEESLYSDFIEYMKK